MTVPIEIRLAVIEEVALIANVLRQAFLEYEPAYTPPAFAATTPTAEQIHDRFTEGPVWVAIGEGVLVGTVSAVLKGSAVYVRSMAVLPAARGQGLGVKLLQQTETFARDHQAQQLFLSTTPFLSRAIRLYETYGFRRTADGPHELFGTPLFTMVKPLSE